MDADAWDARYAESPQWSATPNDLVAAELGALSPGTAVDLAAGEGRHAIWLAEHGWAVTAVDFAEAGLARGRRAAEDRGVQVTWEVADVVTWRPHEPVDLVLLAYLHLVAEERRRVHRTAVESLAPGGTFLLVGHDASNIAEGVGGPQDPTVLCTAEDVLADVAGLPFHPQRAERVARTVVVDGVERTAYDVVVRGQRPSGS
ncbi:MAG: class I SAM-dependent methyltransferase [Nocardioides sp.]|nr:class I SAM-dependent methyltransferase [Nocardioides sp.]